uniref:Glucosylceramidase n=1 Tax=Acrobeloides nanus TaxID=290746 RepID=A0A914EDN8_9BILA
MAQELIGTNLRLFACPWSAPSWMKTNYDMSGNGSTMKGDLYNDTRYWGTWSKYFVRFFEEYGKQNVRFWGLTIQNEPLTKPLYTEMFMPANVERDFLKKFLGPAIRAHPATSHLKIMIYDQDRGSCGPYGVDGHQECGADKFIGVVLGDEAAASYVDGVSMHWYEDGFVNASMLDSIHNSYPEKWIMHTEV